MKKYVKPMIVFESFSLSTSIAACGFEASFSDEIADGCRAYEYESDFGEMVLFMEVTVGCVDTPAGSNDQICYHVAPDAYQNLFGS